MHILTAILLIAGGIALIVYHQQLYKIFGPIDRAERQFGDSRAIYVLMGCGLIVVGVFVLFAGGAGGVDDAQQLKIG